MKAGFIRDRLTYANIVSTLALVAGLGGTASAAMMVYSTNIADGTIRNRDVRMSTLTGSRIANGSITAADLSSSAVEAFTETCPSGTMLYGGICFETATRAAANFHDASITCANASRRLPTYGELSAFDTQPSGVIAFPGEVTGSTFSDVDQYAGEIGYLTLFGAGAGGTEPFSQTRPYRCVRSPR